ncbi:MAG TPA: hypothetical protein VL860_13640, partial [Planctomycetota bacterium]|nr:hypothetical protein [Planctomycetota bacterium]
AEKAKAAAAAQAAREAHPTAADELQCGPRASAKVQGETAAVFRQVIGASGLGFTSGSSGHFTLIGSDSNVKLFLPALQGLEAKLQERFPGIIKAGLDKRSAAIVVVDNQNSYKTWIRAEFHALGIDGPPDNAADANAESQLDLALKSRDYYLPMSAVIDLSCNDTAEQRASSVAYGAGYMYMFQLTEGLAPDGLVTGFGNYCEALASGQPHTRVMSYEDRQLGKGPRESWAFQVREAIGDKTCISAADVLNLSMVTMKSVEYAEAWSLVSYLAQKPVEFDALVTALRDKGAAPEAIQKLYKVDLAGLTKDWQTSAGKDPDAGKAKPAQPAAAPAPAPAAQPAAPPPAKKGK